MIGYFDSRESTNYKSFEKMATALKDECVVLAGFGDQFRHARPAGQDAVVVRKAASAEDIAHPGLDLMNTQKLTDWAQRSCVPLVRGRGGGREQWRGRGGTRRAAYHWRQAEERSEERRWAALSKYSASQHVQSPSLLIHIIRIFTTTGIFRCCQLTPFTQHCQCRAFKLYLTASIRLVFHSFSTPLTCFTVGPNAT